MHLPRVSDFGKYRLPCGSIIYPSTRLVWNDHHGERRVVRTGEFFLWRCTAQKTADEPAQGEVVTDKTGIRYFDSPEQALFFHTIKAA